MYVLLISWGFPTIANQGASCHSADTSIMGFFAKTLQLLRGISATVSAVLAPDDPRLTGLDGFCYLDVPQKGSVALLLEGQDKEDGWEVMQPQAF